MMGRKKLFGLIPRALDISSTEFHEHYRHPHGTCGTLMSTLRSYVQSHRIHTDLLGPSQSLFEAIAEMWLDSVDDVVNFRDEPVLVKYLKQDEPKFIDITRGGFLITDEEVIRSGPSVIEGHEPADLLWSPFNRALSVKLMIVICGTHRVWTTGEDAVLGRRLGSLRQVRCRAEDPGFKGAATLAYHGVHELWWPTVTAFRQGVAADREAYDRLLANAGESIAMLAQAERFS